MNWQIEKFNFYFCKATHSVTTFLVWRQSKKTVRVKNHAFINPAFISSFEVDNLVIYKTTLHMHLKKYVRARCILFEKL